MTTCTHTGCDEPADAELCEMHRKLGGRGALAISDQASAADQRTLRLPRAELAKAVAPEPLASVLRSLVNAGAIAGFEESDTEVAIWGDLLALEAHHTLSALVPSVAPGARDARGEYFQLCQAFTDTHSFRKLPARNKSIWRLHARGTSHQQIASRLRISLMQVRSAVKGARLAAGLNAVATAMPRGGGGGRPTRPAEMRPRCKAECGKLATHRGYCDQDYQRARRGVVRKMFGSSR